MKLLEISDIKEVFDPLSWQERVRENPRKVYGFLLFADEHKAFRSYIREAWRSLDKLSGEACDIFTLEQPISTAWGNTEQFNASNYLAFEGLSTGQSRFIAPEDNQYDEVCQKYPDVGRFGGAVIDNGIKLPDRTQCYDVRDRLFEQPAKIILPGLALFANIYTKNALYFNFDNLNREELSSRFQYILTSIREIYESNEDRLAVLQLVKKMERNREIKERLTQALSKISLKDVFDILSGVLSAGIAGLRMCFPK